jgi:hypothetical protein
VKLARIVSHNSGSTEQPVLGDAAKVEDTTDPAKASRQKDEKVAAAKAPVQTAAKQEDADEDAEEKPKPAAKKHALA